MASPQESANKEVKVILDLVRMKGKSLRPKFTSILTVALISGLLVSIPVPANAAACNPTITTATNGDKILSFTNAGTCEWTVPAKATIIPKASTSTNKNSATATVTGLKPGQKVKVTVNVKGK